MLRWGSTEALAPKTRCRHRNAGCHVWKPVDSGIDRTVKKSGFAKKGCKQNKNMANIRVRDLPEDVHATLRDKAARQHQSLRQYLTGELTRIAHSRSLDEILDEIGALEGGRVGFATAVGDLTDARPHS